MIAFDKIKSSAILTIIALLLIIGFGFIEVGKSMQVKAEECATFFEPSPELLKNPKLSEMLEESAILIEQIEKKNGKFFTDEQRARFWSVAMQEYLRDKYERRRENEQRND